MLVTGVLTFDHVFYEGVNNMKEATVNEERPFESWSKLIEKTMSGYPFTQAFTGVARDGKEDPLVRIDRPTLGCRSDQ